MLNPAHGVDITIPMGQKRWKVVGNTRVGIRTMPALLPGIAIKDCSHGQHGLEKLQTHSLYDPVIYGLRVSEVRV